MSLSIRDLLESKGITVPEDHLPIIKTRLQSLESFKTELESALLDDYDIALRNIPGGDHIE